MFRDDAGRVRGPCVPICRGPDGGAERCVDSGVPPPDLGPCGGPCEPGRFCSPFERACVECDEVTPCDGAEGSDRPACIGGRCRPCIERRSCRPYPDRPACDRGSGRCVECTADDRQACDASPEGRNVCDPRARTCTSIPPASADVCAPCVADAQCMPGRLCMPVDRGDHEARCFWEEDAPFPGPGGSCRERGRPYSLAQDGQASVDGVRRTTCRPARASCEALADVGRPCTMDRECGLPDVETDASCATVGPDRVCASSCTSDRDCPPALRCRSLDDACVPDLD